MITAIDTSVLIAIDQGEASAENWVELLADAREEGGLVICEIVAAEFFAVVGDEVYYRRFLATLGIVFVNSSQQAACLAGKIFRQYRDKGGPREHLVPDFLVAAHALVDCNQLASLDRGYTRKWFPRLSILSP